MRSARALSVAAILVVCAAFYWLGTRRLDSRYEPPPVPAELAKPGLRLWEGKRDTWVVLAAPRLGIVTQILQQPLGGAPDEVLLVGTDAALRTLAPPARARWVAFEDPGDGSAAWSMQAADLDRDGRYEFFNRSGNWHPATIYDADGRIRSRPAREWGVNQMAPGQLDDDGRLDFVVGTVSDGLWRLDANGEVVWNLESETARDVALADLDEDGRDEILHSAPCGRFVVRDGDGTILSDVPMEPAVHRFALTRWGSTDGSSRVAYLRDDRLWLVAPDGSGRQSLELGVDASHGRPAVATVLRSPGEEPALALLVDYRLFDRSVLNLYDANGELFHQQVLPWSCPAITVDARDPDAEVLLLGCEGRLVANGPHLSAYRRSLAINEAFEGPDSANLQEDLRAIAWALVHRDRGAEALPYARRAVNIAEASDESELAESLNTLGMVALELDRREEAASHLERALEVLAPDHPESARIRADVHYNLGGVRLAEKQLDAAERHYLLSLEANTNPADLAKAAHNLAGVYLDQQRYGDAEQMIQRAVDMDTKAYSPDHAEVHKNLRLYARILRGAGRTVEAEAIETRIEAQPGDSNPRS